mmetsp:Transcript_12537/g.35225  ORF Transcript_12537/g.35225 Transcript_12537/m.35225 type:complete len:222 (+) Transcript_12537:2221-2886(+)
MPQRQPLVSWAPDGPSPAPLRTAARSCPPSVLQGSRLRQHPARRATPHPQRSKRGVADAQSGPQQSARLPDLALASTQPLPPPPLPPRRRCTHGRCLAVAPDLPLAPLPHLCPLWERDWPLERLPSVTGRRLAASSSSSRPLPPGLSRHCLPRGGSSLSSSRRATGPALWLCLVGSSLRREQQQPPPDPLLPSSSRQCRRRRRQPPSQAPPARPPQAWGTT